MRQFTINYLAVPVPLVQLPEVETGAEEAAGRCNGDFKYCKKTYIMDTKTDQKQIRTAKILEDWDKLRMTNLNKFGEIRP